MARCSLLLCFMYLLVQLPSQPIAGLTAQQQGLNPVQPLHVCGKCCTPGSGMLILTHPKDGVEPDPFSYTLCLPHELLKRNIWFDWLGLPSLQEQHRHTGCKAWQHKTPFKTCPSHSHRQRAFNHHCFIICVIHWTLQTCCPSQ